MIGIIDKDIFSIECDAIVHQANCMNTMGSGIAKNIRELFPEAYEADCKTIKGDRNKLGMFSWAKVKNKKYSNIKIIINLYSQYEYGHDKRYTSYDSLYDGFKAIRDAMVAKYQGVQRILAVPYRLGCNKGGGDWNVVFAIIDSIFKDCKEVRVIICRNPAIENKLYNKESK